MKVDKKGYTQREWDRVVGYGKVPKEYQKNNVQTFSENIQHFPKKLGLSGDPEYPSTTS